MRRREGDPPSVLHFAANRPREFPFAPGFGILGPSPPLKSSTAPPFSSFPPCRYHHRSRLSEASRDTPTAAVLVNVCFSRRPPTVSSPPKLLLFFLSYHIQLSARSNGRNSKEPRRRTRSSLRAGPQFECGLCGWRPRPRRSDTVSVAVKRENNTLMPPDGPTATLPRSVALLCRRLIL